ncbi:Lrp/AsnC family transcriptional regulator [Temperatibacter marinus]|uniref:Lrp/AsnC family transcriptional regulator n=1 Tax=Temperatibacter marinus TaxID=1456591 RepID=A0AA52H9X2_9PROT|nr:Lrp/AsnC family transcriptional regulator [Temperatibacter marinus]WND02033.1 Lrp/AsnC family transcriptional regulator [Temperatibacter marinus]
MQTDKIDRAILTQLQDDGKLSNVDLSNLVGLSESACLRRVKRMETEGIITQYTAIVSAKTIGLTSSVFIRVSLQSQQEEKLKRFEQAVQNVREVMECYLMSGEVDYMLRVIVRDGQDYERVHNILTALPEVARVHSSFALRNVIRRTHLPL